MKAPLPSKLYKYQSCNENARNNLRGRSIWFSKPESFNDPFDCNVNFPLGDITEESLELLFTSLREKSPNNKDFDRIYHSDGKVTKLFKEHAIESFRKAASKLGDIFASLGVVCFAEKNDDILMWSHYAASHKGFCLEFDTTKFPFTSTNNLDQNVVLERVSYSNSLPLVSLEDIKPNHLPVLSRKLLSVKSLHWSYEKEWRLFSNPGDVAHPYDNAALTGIYLGCKIEDDNKKIIRSILQGTSTSIYEMEKSKTEFKIAPREVR